MQDEKPSGFFNQICGEEYFLQPPFDMLYKLQETEQSPVYHPEGNVWNHTMLVVDEAAQLKHKSTDSRVFMWTALLHDIGKPPATKIIGGKITAYNHDKLGAVLAKKFLQSLTDDEIFIDAVTVLVRWHMQVFYVARKLPFADIRAIKEQTNFNEVALVGLADRLGRPGADRPAEEQSIKLFLEKCNEVKVMPKAGMRRPDPKDPHGTESNHKTHLPKNDSVPVPEIQGKEKHSKKSPK
jgi:putative nucleotidyltransferase with HDIG domain